jgi:hypothetical protein
MKETIIKDLKLQYESLREKIDADYAENKRRINQILETMRDL